MRKHFIGLASEQKAIEAAPAMRCHDNEIAALVLGGRDNALGWVLVLHVNELAVDAFFLEYDDARSGGFAPLRFVPRGNKRVVLGLVTSKRAALESKDDLKRRVDEAAKFVPLEQLCLSPQCGFSSTVEGNALTLDEQIAKLRLVVETAREIWS